MKKMLMILTVLFAGTSVWASGIEISEDGHTVSYKDENTGSIPLITDEVPFALTPDYAFVTRMQVGGLDFGDFDNDGDYDLAVGCYSSQSYPPYNDWRNFVLVNNDGILESSPSWWSSDMRSTADVRWGDINGDGYLDLFASNGGFSFDPSVIYFGSESGLAANPGWYGADVSFSLCAALHDYDHDGDLDVATANQGISPVPYRPIYIFENNNGILPTAPTWQTPDSMIANFVKWGDMDGDGWYELAASKWANFSSGIYANNNGTLSNYPVWTNGNTNTEKGIDWADFDSDGYPEIAIGASSNPTSVYDNAFGSMAVAPFWSSSNSSHGCQDLIWGDVDHDGDPDLLTVHFSTGHVRLYLNDNGVMNTTPDWQYDSSESGTAIALGDINLDDYLDLAVGLSGDTSVVVFMNMSLQTSTNDDIALPENSNLSQNYPNPFNANTNIEFKLETDSYAKLEIFDLMGRKISTLVDGNLAAGIHTVNWDANDFSSGLYYYRLSTEQSSEVKRMTLLK